jgi:hypothetical protein
MNVVLRHLVWEESSQVIFSNKTAKQSNSFRYTSTSVVQSVCNVIHALTIAHLRVNESHSLQYLRDGFNVFELGVGCRKTMCSYQVLLNLRYQSFA